MWSIRDVDTALAASNEYLLRLVDAPFTGFREGLDRNPTAWATADGMLALRLTGTPAGTPVLHECASALISMRDRRTGVWESRGVPSVEATSMALIAIATCTPSSKLDLSPSLSFILEAQSAGGFAAVPGGNQRVFATAMAMWALSTASDLVRVDRRDPLAHAISEGRDWLLEHACSSGGWNARGDEQDDPLIPYTGAALFALSLAPETPRVVDSVASAIDYLVTHPPADLSDRDIELRSAGKAELRTVHLALPWAVIGLASTGPAGVGEPFDRLVRTLLDGQRRDGTDAGGFPWMETNRRAVFTIWSTFRSVHALALARKLEIDHGVSMGAALVRQLPARIAALEAAIHDLRQPPEPGVQRARDPAVLERRLTTLERRFRVAGAGAAALLCVAVGVVPWILDWGPKATIVIDSLAVDGLILAVLRAFVRDWSVVRDHSNWILALIGVTGAVGLLIGTTGGPDTTPTSRDTPPARTTK